MCHLVGPLLIRPNSLADLGLTRLGSDAWCFALENAPAAVKEAKWPEADFAGAPPTDSRHPQGGSTVLSVGE
jgi:hypothetical protein